MREHHIDTNGIRLHVTDQGTGPLVILCHGWPELAYSWRHQIRALAAAGYRVVAPDMRGYGRSDAPDDVNAYSILHLVGDMVGLVHACGERQAIIVGHDWGGALAWHLGAHHPERVRSLTVLSTPHPAAMASSMTRSLQPLRSWYTVAVQVPLLPEIVLSRTLAPALRLSGLPEDLAAGYAARLGTPTAVRGPLAWYRAAGRRPPWELLGAGGPGADVIGVPTTYLWGRHDPALGRAAAEATADHVHGDYLFRELDAGHWLPELHPHEVGGAVLDRVQHAA